jgi:hypothetical protein
MGKSGRAIIEARAGRLQRRKARALPGYRDRGLGRKLRRTCARHQCVQEPTYGWLMRFLHGGVPIGFRHLQDRRVRVLRLDPVQRAAGTINRVAPLRVAMGTGLAATARTDVSTAAIAPTSRSSSSGNETTLIIKTASANRKPMPLPTMMSIQPAGVVKTWRTKSGIEAAGSEPKFAK